MYAEWKIENTQLRPMLLYYLELFILSFGRDVYFSKGNLTSAKKVKAFCDEGEIDPRMFVLIGFLRHKDGIQKYGFRYLVSKYVKLSVVNELLAGESTERYLAPGTKPPTVFDKLRVELKRANLMSDGDMSVITVEDILARVIQGELSYEALVYLSLIDDSFYEKAKPILKALKKKDKVGFSKAETKISLCLKRGILPKLLCHIEHNKTCYDWAVTGDPEKNEQNKSKTEA